MAVASVEFLDQPQHRLAMLCLPLPEHFWGNPFSISITCLYTYITYLEFRLHFHSHGL